MPLAEFLDAVAAHLDDAEPPSFYMGSTDLDTYLPASGRRTTSRSTARCSSA
jgi:hypothetical protein